MRDCPAPRAGFPCTAGRRTQPLLIPTVTPRLPPFGAEAQPAPLGLPPIHTGRADPDELGEIRRRHAEPLAHPATDLPVMLPAMRLPGASRFTAPGRVGEPCVAAVSSSSPRRHGLSFGARHGARDGRRGVPLLVEVNPEDLLERRHPDSSPPGRRARTLHDSFDKALCRDELLMIDLPKGEEQLRPGVEAMSHAVEHRRHVLAHGGPVGATAREA